MRLSNILVRQAEIAFLALALLPFIPPGTRNAYIDTPALHAVVSAVNELRRGGETEAYLAAENFRSYYGVEDFAFTEVNRSVAVVSASSSGSLAAKLTSRGFDPNSVIHLLFLGESRNELRIALDLAFHRTLNPSGHDPARRTYEKDCVLCTQGSMFIELRGDQFDISPPQPLPLVVRQKHAPDGLAFQMERLVGSRCFTSSASRLHWLDPSLLLSHQAYRDRLDYYLRRFVPGRSVLRARRRPVRRVGTGGSDAKRPILPICACGPPQRNRDGNKGRRRSVARDGRGDRERSKAPGHQPGASNSRSPSADHVHCWLREADKRGAAQDT